MLLLLLELLVICGELNYDRTEQLSEPGESGNEGGFVLPIRGRVRRFRSGECDDTAPGGVVTPTMLREHRNTLLTS